MREIELKTAECTKVGQQLVVDFFTPESANHEEGCR